MDSETIGITEHELIALLGMYPTPSSAKSLEIFGLVELAKVPQIAKAGVQSLLLREFASFEGEQVVAAGNGKSMATVLATGEEWYVFMAKSPLIQSCIVLVTGPAGRMAFGINPTGVHGVSPIDPVAPLGDILRHFATGFDSPEITRPVDIQIRRSTISGSSGQGESMAKLFIEADGWRFEDLLSDLRGSVDEVWPRVLPALGLTS